MARNVYFSFHYDDVKSFRANVVRMSYKFRAGDINFRDASIWEESKEKQVSTIKKLIDSELMGSSVTCVLIGSETYSRRFVRYEIAKSFEMKKGQLGVGINWIKDNKGEIKFWPGENPFDYLKLKIDKGGKIISLFELRDDGWIEFRDLRTIRNNHFPSTHYGRTITLSSLYKK